LRFAAAEHLLEEHFTGRTYNNIIYSSQRNPEGKRLDAFMNHIGQQHQQLFALLKNGTINISQVQAITFKPNE
jgi:hypothetical protein